ncbi:uncharacterized protein LOC134699837 [Mytilus trossulus]|uniref:uncharacterized protein LOC134699837 n=1 Tax=Mytilus trossulus TaxID=6551 RepID=UPI003005C890
MTEAAQYICGFNDGWRISKKQNCEKLAGKLQHGLETKWKLIHVHSINDTINSLDKAIQDALYQIFCKGNKKNYRIIDNILRCVDLWNRPDISEKEIFNIENINVVKTLQASLVEEESKLSKLFKNALVGNKVDIVKQVLEYIQDKRLYKTFLENNIKTLYKKTDCISRDLISEHSKCIARSMINEQEKNQKSKNFVKSINIVVIKILGSRKWKPFQENMDNKGWGNTEDTCNIYEGDVFKHLFIWAVLMDRRELAMLFWKKENSDYICSALYASSLARCLAEHASWEESIDQKTDLLESSRLVNLTKKNVK